MTRPVERIEQDITALNQAITAIAKDLQSAYQNYLTALGQAVRQQTILASFHLCTHGYPERFLKLSFSQRQQLQQSLRQLTKQTQAELLNALRHDPDFKPQEYPVSFDGEIHFVLDDETDEANEQAVQEKLEAFLADESPFEQEETGEREAADLADADASVEPDFLEKLSLSLEEQVSTPQDLLQWQQTVEAKISEALQSLSHAANLLLQKSNVLPKQLPEPVLEVATKSDLSAEAPGPPNLLNLLIEAEMDDDNDASLTHIMAIRLRLSEIEFSDANTAAWRSKIRGLMARVSQLAQEYQKRQREKAIAEAESAWRSSWYEE